MYKKEKPDRTVTVWIIMRLSSKIWIKKEKIDEKKEMDQNDLRIPEQL